MVVKGVLVSKYADRAAIGDRVMESMMRDVAPRPLDPEKTHQALNAALESLKKQAERLAALDYDKEVKCPTCQEKVFVPLPAPDLARTMAYTGKVLDEIYRLSEFAQGRADSRPELQGGGLLEHLTDEQISELSRWVEQGKQQKGLEVKPKGTLLQ